MTIESMYQQLVKSALEGTTDQKAKELLEAGEDPYHLDCLLHPEKHAAVWRTEQCACPRGGEPECVKSCVFGAIEKDEKGNVIIAADRCTGCSACLERCKDHKLIAGKDVLPVLSAVHKRDVPVFALIAPAFVGQYKGVSPGQLRTAFKRLGFAGMVEVALFADILTLKEALSFDHTIHNNQDYLLTSCCCPVWIAMIRKAYHQMSDHIPGSVSPMIACGRAIKKMYPDAMTAFIGPCIAKKAEAREADIADAVDYVLTFQEMRDVFQFAEIEVDKLEDDYRDHSSYAGRVYARSGGVSKAVETTLERISPKRKMGIRTKYVSGIPACRALLNDLVEGNHDANFLEGMGCVGGCVGGPKAITEMEQGTQNVDEYAESAAHMTPIDNPFVVEILNRLGYETVESLLGHEDMFSRDLQAEMPKKK